MKKIITVSMLALSIFCLSSCTSSRNNGTQNQEQRKTEGNQERLLKAVPVPEMTTSEERKNLVRRLETFNSEDKISYIYLVSYGKVMAFYPIKGKVSSVNSLLTTPDQIIGTCNDGDFSTACSDQVVASPDIDGSYGENGDAIFFFTTEGVYVEWRGDYLLADAPLRITTPPELVRTVE